MDPMSCTAATLRVRADALADDLQVCGRLTEERFRRLLRDVPRHLFVPSTGWVSPDHPGGDAGRIDRDADPYGWWEAVYSDSAIVIQSDDGAGDPAGGQGSSTSSVSAPGIVVQFLELLDARDHHRVLEIGTGSGWTSALLSGQVGDRNVTSIEVDEQVAAVARANLHAAGYAPRLVVGDGAKGWQEAAPYDRVHVTCGVADIPEAWISQVRPGGVVVLPWCPGSGSGHMVRLTVVGDGCAVGSFHGAANYMMLRAQRQALSWKPHHADQAATVGTRLDPRTVGTAGLGAQLAITALAPGIGWHTSTEESGDFSMLLFEIDAPEGSWAACDYEPGADEFNVTHYGDRNLRDEVGAAYLRWCSWGGPGHQRYGLALDRSGTVLWLDSPDRVLRRLESY